MSECCYAGQMSVPSQQSVPATPPSDSVSTIGRRTDRPVRYAPNKGLSCVVTRRADSCSKSLLCDHADDAAADDDDERLFIVTLH